MALEHGNGTRARGCARCCPSCPPPSPAPECDPPASLKKGCSCRPPPQVKRVHHVSNLYYIPAQGQLAQMLTDRSPTDKVMRGAAARPHPFFPTCAVCQERPPPSGPPAPLRASAPARLRRSARSHARSLIPPSLRAFRRVIASALQTNRPPPPGRAVNLKH